MTTTPPCTVDKDEGNIGDSFASLAGEKDVVLPPRYLELKRRIIGDKENQKALIAAWARLTSRLAQLADVAEETGHSAIPVVSYNDLIGGLSPELLNQIRDCGSVVVRNVISPGQAVTWLDDIRKYITDNAQVKGFPADDKQVYEIYWSKPQLEARSHPRMLRAQQALLSIFTYEPEASVSLHTPLLYADRLRIRQPGDAKFALGPHMDGGSIERWEDDDYRAVFDDILKGQWEDYNTWEIGKRAVAKHDLYPGPGSTGLFRAWQGWTSLSETGPSEGTLLAYPYIREHTAYVLMRPLFKSQRSRDECAGDQEFLSPENWELDFETTKFPGSPPYRGQEVDDQTHPHLQLRRTMVPMPKVYPGDSVWWHSDIIHAVEPKHNGDNAAAVLYIPAVPLTSRNAKYLKAQRTSLESGRPPPDFPGGTGESRFHGRGKKEDLLTAEGRQGIGLEPFELSRELSRGTLAVRKLANAILGH